MSDPADYALLFGSLGNLAEAMGPGWSVEDHFAWAVGDESRLNLPLPAAATRYSVRLTVQPLVHAGLCAAQRLAVETEAGPLASFRIARQTTLELDLPIELTRNRRSLQLILRHPDALRPSDFQPTDDNRLLSLCFLSGAVHRRPDAAPAPDAAPRTRLAVAGGDLARQVATVMRALPALRRHLDCRFVASGAGAAAAGVAADLGDATLCWQESILATPPATTPPATTPPAAPVPPNPPPGLPAGCALQHFPAPRLTALWPFLGNDPRLVPEPGRYPAGRYPFGDRIAAVLAPLQLADDVMLLAYQSMTEKEMPDLDGLLAADLAAWQALDATHRVQVADFLRDGFRRTRLFFSPRAPAGPLLAHLVSQLVAGSPLAAHISPTTLQRELDGLLAGYLGNREELPIDPHVARRFGLAWWQPGMRYRWHSNLWTFEEYTLRALRWTPWRP